MTCINLKCTPGQDKQYIKTRQFLPPCERCKARNIICAQSVSRAISAKKDKCQFCRVQRKRCIRKPSILPTPDKIKWVYVNPSTGLARDRPLVNLNEVMGDSEKDVESGKVRGNVIERTEVSRGMGDLTNSKEISGNTDRCVLLNSKEMESENKSHHDGDEESKPKILKNDKMKWADINEEGWTSDEDDGANEGDRIREEVDKHVKRINHETAKAIKDLMKLIPKKKLDQAKEIKAQLRGEFAKIGKDLLKLLEDI